VTLIVLAHLRRGGPDNWGEVQAILAEFEAERAAYAAAQAATLAALPADAPIGSDWDFTQVAYQVHEGWSHPMLQLLDACIANPFGLPESALEDVRTRAEGPAIPCGSGAFSGRIVLADRTAENVREQVDQYLLTVAGLDQVAYALEAGLCHGACEIEPNPRFFPIVGLCLYLGARAVAHARAGQEDAAYATCDTGFELAARFDDWPTTKAYRSRYHADSYMMRALWAIVDLAPPDEHRRAVILDRLDRAHATERLGKVTRYHAALMEAGAEARAWHLPQFGEWAFGLTGSGSLEQAGRLLAILEEPPYRHEAELEAIGKRRFAAYWHNDFVEKSTRAVKRNARTRLWRRAAAAAFALKDFKARTGAYPDELEDAPSPEGVGLIDPLTNERAAYERQGQGFSLKVPSAMMLFPEYLWAAKR